jgi:hypothetical protein
VALLAGGQGSSREVATGGALFFGVRPLAAHVAGQDWELPRDASACSNCHERGPLPAPGAASATGPSVSFGPPLRRENLTRAIGRRGGPPSAYDGAKLCRAMRDGIDPALVIIPRTMPRYAITDEECLALWAFLSTRS